jgi:TctA family transporter
MTSSFPRQFLSNRLVQKGPVRSSNGDYLIFFSRPISLGLLIVSVIMLTLSAITFVLKRKDRREKLAEAEDGEMET